MAKKNIKEAEDNSLDAIMYQGKSLAQWEKEFDGEFTVKQLFQLIKSGIDLGRIKHGLVDEAKDIDDKELFRGEAFFFNENDIDENDASIKDYITPNVELRIFDAPKGGNEIWRYTIDPNNAMPAAGYIGASAQMLLPNEKKDQYPEAFGVLYLDGKPLATDKNVLKYQIDDIMKRAMRVAANTIDFSKVKAVAENEVDESARQPEDVVTVGDFIELLNRDAKLDDKIMFRVHKKNGMLFAVNSRGGTAVVDIVPAMDESITPEQWKEAMDWFNANGYEIEDDEDRLEEIAPQGDQFLFKIGMSPSGKDEVISGDEGFELYKSLKESKEMKSTTESRGWYGGGYGGTGKSYSKLGGRAPRGEAIGWYSVEQLDPKAAGKMPGWRCGPSNFPFEDTFFPNRKYKVGTMVMRNKYVNAGPFSGEMYIAIPSYFEIVNTKNPEGIKVLETLGIPLDLTFGMDPNDDYSVTYIEK